MLSSWTRSWGGLLVAAAFSFNVANTFAQEICDQSPLTITTRKQLLELANCTSVPGDLTIQYVDAVNITIDSLETIGGMAQIHLADRSVKISAENLTSIGGLFMIAGGIDGRSNMKNISFPLLNSTSGLDFTSMPNLRTLEFPSRINNPLPAIRVTIMNTGLDSLDGLNIDYKQVQQVYLGGNPNLGQIRMGLENITVNLDIDGSGGMPDVSFPELGYLNNANLHDIGSLNLESLTLMGGALGIYDCMQLEKLELPKLKRIGARTVSSLAIANNTDLITVSFPELESITGGITTENNKRWLKLTSFPKLKVVTDDINMKGAFTLVKFPELYNATGKFDIRSESGLTYNCQDLEKMNTETSKPFVCDPYGVNVYRPAEGEKGPESNQSSDQALTGPKITGIAIGCLVAVIVPLLFIRYVIVQRRKKNMLREKDHFNSFHSHGPRELDSRSLPRSRSRSRAELPPHAMDMAYELPVAKMRQEMEGDIPVHELPDTPTSQTSKKEAEVSTFFVPDSPIERAYRSRTHSDVSTIEDFQIETAQAYGITTPNRKM